VTREELEHAIRAACDIAQDSEVYVFGSQAILGQFPDAPASVRMSQEADISPRNLPERVDAIDANLGEDSPFHRAHGFYVHGVSIGTATLPKGWQIRTVQVRNRNTRDNNGWCVEGHDLAASKLAAFRDKDRDFARNLLLEGLITPRKLITRLRLLPLPHAERERLVRWVDIIARDLSE
jgi:hypothetical protein